MKIYKVFLLLFTLSFFEDINSQVTLYSEDFSNTTLNNKGYDASNTPNMDGVNNWSVSVGATSSASFATGKYFKQLNGSFQSKESEAVGNNPAGAPTSSNFETRCVVWSSLSIDISSYSDITFSTDLGRVSNNSYSGVKAYYTVNGGTTWVEFGSIVGSTGCADNSMCTFSVSLLNVVGTFAQIKIAHWGTSGTPTYKHDNVLIEGTAPCSPPSTQASGLNFSSIGPFSVNVSWTNGNGDNVLVVAKKTSSVSTDPDNSTNYNANSSFGSGSQIGTGNFVVYKGNGSNVLVSNLDFNINYTFSVYSFFNNSGVPCYNLVEHTANVSTYFNRNFYVNDDCSTPNVFCNAGVVGSASNSGMLPSSPKRTLKDLWNTYGPAGSNILTAGDTIFIDAGRYARGGTDAVTNESKFNISIPGIVFQGAGVDKTIFDNDNYGTNTDYFMEINANNVSLRDLTVTNYESNAGNSGTTYSRGVYDYNTGGQAISIFGCTGVLIENVNTFDNGNGGNAAIGVGQNTTAIFRGGGSNCNATGSSYSGGIDIYGGNNNITIENYVLAYNSKDAYNGAGLMIFGATASTIVNVKNTVISNNMGGAGGGAVYIDGANATFKDCIITTNSTSGSWGPNRTGNGFAIVGGTVKILRSIIENNVSSTTTDFGGVGINTSSSNINLTIDSCLFRGNSGTKSSGKDLGAMISGGGTFSITVNETTFGNYEVGTSQIDIGGNSTFSCTGSSFKITNSGNPSIVYTNSGATNCSLGAGSNTNNPTYIPNPVVPNFSGPCGSFIILPVELLDFKANCNNKNVEINWSTQSEHNNDYFILQKAGTNFQFEDIARIKGNGNTVSLSEYQYVDFVENNETVYYKLKQVDFDGNERVIKTIANNFDCISNRNEFKVYVNSNEELTLFYEFIKNSNYEIQIYDLKGLKIDYTNFELEQNSNQFKQTLNNPLKAGAYIISLKNEESISVFKLIIN